MELLRVKQRSLILLAAALVSLAIAGLPNASAWETEGELTMHDDPDTEATIQIADCTFWVRGHSVELEEGRVDIYHNMGRGGVALLASENYTGTTSDDDGFDFLAGPFTIEIGEGSTGMRVFAEVVVEGERGEFSDPERYLQSDTATVYCGETFVRCIDDLSAEALPDGSIRLDWSAADNATHYFVSRSDGTQNEAGRLEWVALANTTETSYHDTTTAVGVTYIYDVAASDGALGYAEACPWISVTAVPFFGAPALAAVALVGAVVAYARLRR